MPNVKISELPAASTPLAGTELVPVVQGGATEQVSVANLTAGRAVSASDVTVSNLTASQAVLTDANKKLVSQATTGTGDVVRATGPTIANPTYTGTLTGGGGVVNIGAGQFYKDGSGNVGIGTTSPDAPFEVASGSVLISGVSARITGDFSNATLASRVYFQTSTTNGNTGIGALPNGTATLSNFTAFNSSDPNNASIGQLTATSTDVRVVSSLTGTGSSVPLKFFVGGGEQVRVGGDSTLRSLGSFATNTPPLINAATYTVLGTDFSLRFSTTNCTVTLPAAASFPGRILIITNVTANSVTSDASNVKPLGSDIAGTAILSASAGKFAYLQSDGSFWITLMAN